MLDTAEPAGLILTLLRPMTRGPGGQSQRQIRSVHNKKKHRPAAERVCVVRSLLAQEVFGKHSIILLFSKQAGEKPRGKKHQLLSTSTP